MGRARSHRPEARRRADQATGDGSGVGSEVLVSPTLGLDSACIRCASSRCLYPRCAGSKESLTLRDGRSEGAGAESLVRSLGDPPDSGGVARGDRIAWGSRGAKGNCLGSGLERPDRSVARAARVRGAMGSPLDGHCEVCRVFWLRAGLRSAECLPLPRLLDQGFQPRHAF